MGLLKKVREVFSRRRKKGDLWAWAKKPERDRRRVRRWKALAEFADRNRTLNRSLGRIVQAKAWTEARTVYRKKFRFLKKKIEEREETPGSGSVGFAIPSRPWNPYGKTVPAWMVPWLDRIWDAGCHFTIVSGVRTPAYSQQLCYSMCGAPTCPGRCAGIYSNHNMEPWQGFPHGAIDVSNYYLFGATAQRVGAPFHNALGAQDPVHFSNSGR